jgi:hypothetical protein
MLDINEQFELLLEGVHDKGIFKAVFINGGPGSGKDYVLKSTLGGHGLTEISSDKLMDHLDDPKSADHTKAKNVNELRQMLSLKGRNGLIINDPGDNHERTKELKKRLERVGYDTAMIHVHVEDQVSSQRNIERSKRGGRAIPERNRKFKWDSVQDARVHHAKMFGDNYIEYDNSDDHRTSDPMTIKQKKDELNGIREKIKGFVNTQPASEPSQAWIQSELEKNSVPLPRQGTKLPHPDSEASKQAAEVGLKYLGKGRYGTNKNERSVTHVAVSDNLVEVPPPDEVKKPTKPAPKKIKEDIDSSELRSFNSFRRLLHESIDKGIESGLSMATSGENMSRPSNKDKIEELTGDETTASISAQKDDELKKKGISLSTFKSKKL